MADLDALARFAPVENVMEVFNEIVEAEARVEECKRVEREAASALGEARSRLEGAEHYANACWHKMQGLARAVSRKGTRPMYRGQPPSGGNAARRTLDSNRPPDQG